MEAGAVLSPGIPTTSALRFHGSEVSKLVDSEKAKQVGVDFESVFASLLLKEMQSTLESGSIFGKEANEIYSGFFEMFVGQHIAKTGALGVGDMISSYLEASQ